MQLSAIQFTRARDYSSCGYCKQKNCSFSDGMHAFQLNALDYQDLIDRGWRRCGCYCYKPNNSRTCCPCYTIRCDISEFKISKSHKKILKRMKKYLHDGINDDTVTGETPNVSQINEIQDFSMDPKIVVPENKTCILNTTLIKNLKVETEVETQNVNKIKKLQEPGTAETPGQSNIMLSASTKSLENNSDSKPFQKKAKQLRIERKKAKLLAKGLSIENLKSNTSKSAEKSLSDYINDADNDSLRHKLKIVLVSSSNKGEIVNQEFNLYHKYQNIIHNDLPHKITKSQFDRFLCDTPILVKNVEVNSKEFNDSLFAEFKLYEKYQTIIHNDIVYDKDEFINFLQESPLKVDKSEESPQTGYGSFHQQYWLDDKLIAVGVIDILPNCISSVYFFYDPDYNFLSLGTYGCLREIEFTRQLSHAVPDLKFYYMGYYIHSCAKMRYKGKLTGSYLLCPEKYTWHLLSEEIKNKLDANKYVIFNTKANEKDANEFNKNYLDDIQILFTKSGETTYTPYKNYKRITNIIIDDDLNVFGKLVGKNCSRRILYCK